MLNLFFCPVFSLAWDIRQFWSHCLAELLAVNRKLLEGARYMVNKNNEVDGVSPRLETNEVKK